MRKIARCAAILGLLVGLGSFSPFNAQEPKASQKKTAQKKSTGPKRSATEAEFLKTLPDFKVELIHTSDSASEGSWINMCKDGAGRLIVSGQRSQPMLRFTITDGKVSKVEKLDIPLSEAMGLLWAFDSLYVNASGPEGFGLYRCNEAGDSGKFSVKFLKRFEGDGEHGPHALVLGPDKMIYVVNGNHTKLPKGLSEDSPHRNYKEDHLLPRQWDGNGHAAGIVAPGGYIVRTDADGQKIQLMLAGFRNTYDMAFNGDGELFAFDSDMEWDWGMPWYRPIRILHCISGAEFGWRSGTGKWPSYYPDSLPAAVDVGVGSPTGVTNGTGAKFPAKYQKALYMLDWTYGRLLAVHLTPKGSSYTATFENFVAPISLTDPNAPKKPLPLTDAVVGNDGALYFTIGGRNNQSGLYRVTYTGKESTAPADLKNTAGEAERKLRHEIEAFQGTVDPKAVSFVWPHLSSPDRFLQYSARIALEAQPVAEWKDKALTEKNPAAALTALLALARVGDAKLQPELLKALEAFPISSLSPVLQLDKLRVWDLSFIRQGRPAFTIAKKIIAEVDPLFPTASRDLNRETAQLLIYLQAPGIATKVLKEMAHATYQEDVLFYLFHLRTLLPGNWTMDQRKEYFSYFKKDWKSLKHDPMMDKWFADAGRGYSEGASFPNFLKNFLREAVSNLLDSERKELEPLLKTLNATAVATYNYKPRTTVVKAYTMSDIMPKLDKVDRGRNFEKGKEAFVVGQCVKCHRLGDEGGAVGPDLTSVASRFDRRAILESIIEPSKVLSEQYMNERIVTVGGKTVVGRIVDDTPEKIAVQPDPLSIDRVEIKKNEIEIREVSKVSPMPEHLVDMLTEEEILDLLAYLESSANKRSRLFQK